jgi:hypothetical protein
MSIEPQRVIPMHKAEKGLKAGVPQMRKKRHKKGMRKKG